MHTSSLGITNIRQTAGVSSSALSSSSSSAPWHGSLAPRARPRRTFLSLSYPVLSLLFARSRNIPFATRARGFRSRSRQDDLLTPTPIAVSGARLLFSQPGAAGSCGVRITHHHHHSAALDTEGASLLTGGVFLSCSDHFPRPVAPSHSARARRPPTRVQRWPCRVEWHVLSIIRTAAS